MSEPWVKVENNNQPRSYIISQLWTYKKVQMYGQGNHFSFDSSITFSSSTHTPWFLLLPQDPCSLSPLSSVSPNGHIDPVSPLGQTFPPCFPFSSPIHSSIFFSYLLPRTDSFSCFFSFLSFPLSSLSLLLFSLFFFTVSLLHQNFGGCWAWIPRTKFWWD